MQDRIPTPGQEGRVLITPENGSAPFYATVAMADNPTQEGTPYNKEAVLQDATAALYSLGIAAVPNDVFSYLGKYAQYWWSKTGNIPGYYELVISSPTSRYLTSGVYDIDSSVNIEIGTVDISDSGDVVFTKTDEISVSYRTYTNANSLKGQYFKIISGNNQGGPYYMSTDAPNATRASSGGQYSVSAVFSSVSSNYVAPVIGGTQYLQSNDRNAYPDSGIVDGYEYQYLGVPFDNAATAPKIETGSYVGTGTYGSGNPNTLTFGFVPKIWGILQYVNNGVTYWTPDPNFFYVFGLPVNPGSPSSQFTVSYEGKTVTWYATGNAVYQCNTSNATYYYIAIG